MPLQELKMFLWLSSLAVFLVTPASGLQWNTLTARYSACPLNSFYNLPLRLSEALKQHYYKVQYLEDINVTVYCRPHDPRVCLVFDNFTNIAGVRVTFIEADLSRESLRLYGTPIPYNYSDVSMFNKTVTDDIVGWSAYVLFADPAVLKQGGRTEIIGTADGIYAFLDGNWLKVNRDECKVIFQRFVKGKCKLGRGTHYFYWAYPGLDCEGYQPFFATYHRKEMIGFGFAGIGSWTKGQYHHWFERKPFFGGYKSLMPDDSKCLTEWAIKYDFSIIHFYLIKKRYSIGCCHLGERMCLDPDDSDSPPDE